MDLSKDKEFNFAENINNTLIKTESISINMKKILIIAILAISINVSFGQMDERFYFPDKEWINISEEYTPLVMLCDMDTIYTAIFKPKSTPKATILFFHGNGGNISKWVSYIKPLTDDGFQICMIDYPGYGKSTGKPTHISIQRDVEKWYDTLMTLDYVKNTKLISYGVSIGSQMATNLVKNHNDRFTALVLDGAMKSFTDVALATSPKEHHDVIKAYVTSPYSAVEDIKAIRNAKLLFIHSETDKIPIDGAKEMFETANCPKQMWIYEGKHVEAGSKYPAVMVEYFNKLLE